MQHHVPRELLSRVSSYDMLGSFIAIPVGEIAVGPISNAIVTRATLVGGGVLLLIAFAVALTSRSVRSLQTDIATPVTGTAHVSAAER